jgi:predicted KAP-like P-loop ATPase
MTPPSSAVILHELYQEARREGRREGRKERVWEERGIGKGRGRPFP